jgi:hypothetical protein
MKWQHLALALPALAAALVPDRPAEAVIRVDTTIQKVYDPSGTVVTGTVTAVKPDNRVVEVKVVETVKGESPGEQVRVQIVSPEELLKSVAAGQPAVLFIAEEKGQSMALVHMADTWLMAQLVPNSKPPVYRVVQVFDGKQTFPGRTAAMLRLVGELKAGKSTLLNKVEPNFFHGGIRQLAKLPVAKPAFLAATDVNGDRKPDLLVGTAEGVRLMLAAASAFEDGTEKWGLAKAAGAVAAIGDANGDGRPDLLIGTEIYINDGQKFSPAGARLAAPDGARPLAAAFVGASGNKNPDAMVMLASGLLLTFKNPGAAGKPWTPAGGPRALWQEKEAALAAAFGDWGDTGRTHLMVLRPSSLVRYALDDAGGPPADFERLTGEKPPHALSPEGLKNAVTAAIDYNGDRRPDFFLAADGGSVLLVNRGFGAYLAALDAGSALVAAADRPVPFRLSPATPAAAADLHGDGIEDLLVLTEDGRLFAVDSHPKLGP